MFTRGYPDYEKFIFLAFEEIGPLPLTNPLPVLGPSMSIGQVAAEDLKPVVWPADPGHEWCHSARKTAVCWSKLVGISPSLGYTKTGNCHMKTCFNG